VQSLGILFSTEILRHHGVDHSFGPLCLSTQLLALEGLEYLLTQYISAVHGVYSNITGITGKAMPASVTGVYTGVRPA